MSDRSAAMLQPNVTYGNSYRLPDGSFPVSKVKQEVDKVLQATFQDVVFDPKACGLALREATDEVTKAIR
jgi:hypothetical protein